MISTSGTVSNFDDSDRKYSHNSYWCKTPVPMAVSNKLQAIEFDMVYRLFGNSIWCSHSWRPCNCLYYAPLWVQIAKAKAWNKFNEDKIKYIILESKSFWINQKKLYEIMKDFKDGGFQFVMSVQSKWPHQWLRGIWLKSFYKKYKKELNILDKRTEINLNEQVDLFPKYSFIGRVLNNQF